MTRVGYLIVGGGVAGTTAAEVLRQHDARSTIRIVSDEPYRFYSRIMLSKPSFFLGQVPFDRVFLKPEAWYRDQNVELETGRTVATIDPGQRVVTLNTGEEVGYEKLLLAVGTSVRHWTIPGADKHNVLYLRTLDDAKHIIADVKTTKHALVIGGGFIGFEMCDLLRLAKIETTLLLRERYFWEPLLDETSGHIIEAALKKGGVKIRYQTEVAEVLGDRAVSGVRLKSGEELSADMIVVGIGTYCPLNWVAKAGIACNRGIIANEYLETNVPNVWAAGDVAEYQDTILGERIQFGDWVNAQVQGRVAALNMFGQRQPFHLVSFYTAHGFDTSIAFVGDIRMHDTRTVVTRGTPGSGAYTRIILEGNRIIGATMINRTVDLNPLTHIIEHRADVRSHLSDLHDPAFDLNRLVTPA